MPMQKTVPAASPNAYVAALDGWRRRCVEQLRASVASAATMQERIKWGHLVYFSNGPVLLIRAEAQRVLFGFWRGQLLRDVEPRLKPGGRYEMATMTLNEGTSLEHSVITALVTSAVALNAKLGDPSDISKA